MTIEKISLTDVTELTDLINSAYRGEDSRKGWTSEGHLLEGTRINEQMLIEYLDKKDVTILKLTDESNRIIGTVYLELKGSKLYLGMLSVLPNVQNKRVGRVLLEEAENFAKQHHCTVITITVISARVELINWYERRGFIKSGQLQPFPVNADIGTPKEPLELVEMEKVVK
ncbi:Ribosomal protein S18 acetylase RimI [Chitinophaga sp. CF118]|uniref:GNAT family N-acetyltransferase n=1 Tax=Chitinophaga sp. CF118 TaxID=1884367 RepID=UPI0008E02778|nr:GNAT family N-acetyltransferase [Chitinophaga sp. CF118]SFE07229.1 Ribosomal protein S18 acetylase RimI [Chitinophaga sp. CF118]